MKFKVLRIGRLSLGKYPNLNECSFRLQLFHLGTLFYINSGGDHLLSISNFDSRGHEFVKITLTENVRLTAHCHFDIQPLPMIKMRRGQRGREGG